VTEDNQQHTDPEQRPAGMLDDPYSRRRFLRAAVVGTAGVAGAAGVAGVVLARNGGKAPSILKPFIGSLAQPSRETNQMCFEDTNFNETTDIIIGSNGKVKGSFFVVFAMSDLPTDSYSLEVTQQADGGPTTDITSSSTPFAFASSGGQVLIYEEPAGTLPLPLACPFTKPGGTATFNESTDPATFPVSGSAQDVLVFFHITWSGGTIGSKGSTETITFTGTLTDTTTSTVVSTLTVQVTAHQN
jgi:hypothetical protein